MIVMPAYAIRFTFEGLLPEGAEERVREKIPGTAISHPDDGSTIVAISVTVAGLAHAARDMSGWNAILTHLTGIAPIAASADPLTK
jgi:hypothetical protein